MTTFLFDTDQRCNLMICDAFLLYIMYLLAAAYLPTLGMATLYCGKKVYERLIEWNNNYHKVGSSNKSCLEAHAKFFRLLMKEIVDPYVL